ncbi:MAG: hypothetical protein H7Y08_10635, partial [Rhizobiaceae bacterium]|nr:hypothetical protein [Rhizobiaceae bacterium]
MTEGSRLPVTRQHDESGAPAADQRCRTTMGTAQEKYASLPELERLKARLQRETSARKQAEHLLEFKARELYLLNR